MLKILAELYGLDEAFRRYELVKHRVLEAWIERARRMIEYVAARKAAMQKRLDNAWRRHIVSRQCETPAPAGRRHHA